jgi:hypothetical protein
MSEPVMTCEAHVDYAEDYGKVDESYDEPGAITCRLVSSDRMLFNVSKYYLQAARRSQSQVIRCC